MKSSMAALLLAPAVVSPSTEGVERNNQWCNIGANPDRPPARVSVYVGHVSQPMVRRHKALWVTL